MPTLDTTTPVVVLRCARHGGLGITRSLGRLGVPVYNIDGSLRAPAFASRYSKGSFQWDVEESAASDSLALLRSVASRVGGKPILIPTSDGTAMFIADHADDLAEHFRFPQPGSQLVRSLCSKKEMFFLAKELGIPTAETAFPASRAEALDYVERAKFPIMFKAILGKRLEGRTSKRMFIVHSRDEFVQLYDKYEDPGDPIFMLQEYIPGGDDTVWMFNGYFDAEGQCLASYTGKKIRQYPVHTGLTSLGICLSNERVQKKTQKFMKLAGYRGILDIGYRFDARDQKYKVLDVNPRVGATFRLFVGTDGSDVVRTMYADLTGQPYQASPARDGRKWLVEDCDLVSCYRYFREGEMGIMDWVRSHRGVEETGVFAWDDPVPAWWMGVRDLRQAWGALRGKGPAGLS